MQITHGHMNWNVCDFYFMLSIESIPSTYELFISYRRRHGRRRHHRHPRYPRYAQYEST